MFGSSVEATVDVVVAEVERLARQDGRPHRAQVVSPVATIRSHLRRSCWWR
jgi:hypothetical protein